MALRLGGAFFHRGETIGQHQARQQQQARLGRAAGLLQDLLRLAIQYSRRALQQAFFAILRADAIFFVPDGKFDLGH